MTDMPAANGTPPVDHSVDATPDLVRLSSTTVDRVDAENVEIDASAINTVQADDVQISASGVLQVDADEVSLTNGGIFASRSGHFTANNASVLAAVAESASLSESSAGIVIGDVVHAGPGSRTGILLAREVHGPVETVLDTERAIAFGVAAGIVISIVLMVRGFFSRN